MNLSSYRRTFFRVKLVRTYTTAGCDLDRPFQSYVSTSSDPYLNLSIEHHLLQKTSQASVVLLLYVNRPCVVIGRNQNPWTEVNLSRLSGGIDLVRRRSGGGTVYHDEGNVNWTVISPANDFNRDRHAEMITRALRGLGIQRCRVNERHDIVLDQGGGSSTVGTWGPDHDTHTTPWQHDAEKTVKVSGSAYKLTRGRALHHGTALLNSPNLTSIHDILTAPGRRFIESKGVASVSSPVANLGLGNSEFVKAVQDEFCRMYDQDLIVPEHVGDSWQADHEVRQGLQELSSPDWTFLQTPRFSVRYEDTDLSAVLEVRNGRIDALSVNVDGGEVLSQDVKSALSDQKLYETHDWVKLLSDGAAVYQDRIRKWAAWLQKVLPAHRGQV